ncbi:MAG: VWA domain-containing protein [Deltaproteobacteria bacterium]|nr:VWA domain-containing protein [Deltaproteobacteria bacterium]MBN2670824.1 VWA domain-containing protein [Deltaproteobacteria bacterium]
MIFRIHACIFFVFMAVFSFSPSIDAHRVYTHGDIQAVEIMHDVRMKVNGDGAVYDVKRAFTFSDDGVRIASIVLYLPPHGVVTGFQVHNGQRWIRGKLTGADSEYRRLDPMKLWPHREMTPNEVYATLSLMPNYYKGDVLINLDFGKKVKRVDVAYTVEAPGMVRDGRVRFAYPERPNTEHWIAPTIVSVEPSFNDVRLTGRTVTLPVVLNRSVVLREAYLRNWRQRSENDVNMETLDAMGVSVDHVISIPYRTPTDEFFRAGYGVVRVDAGTDSAYDIARLEMDAFSFGEIPGSPHVVFVFDGSKSMRKYFWQQWAAAAAFLTYMPNAKVTAVIYRREAYRLWDGFVPPERFGEKMSALAANKMLTLQNGSALDSGIEMASAILKQVKGPAYLVAFTDDLLRPSWTSHSAQTAVSETSKQTVSQVIIPTDGEVTFALPHELDLIAAERGGVVMGWNAQTVNYPGILLQSVKEWAVPVRIDDLEVLSGGEETPFNLPLKLGEGESVRVVQNVDNAPKTLRVQGRIWSEPFKRTIRQDAQTKREVLAYALSEIDWQNRDDAIRLAKKIGVLSVDTVFVAATDRQTVPWDETSYFSFEEQPGFIGGTRGGHGGYSPKVKRDVRYEEAVSDTLQAIRTRCGLSVDVTVTVHTTLDEVVDVVVTKVKYEEAGILPSVQCAVDALWTLDLPESFTSSSYQFDL